LARIGKLGAKLKITLLVSSTKILTLENTDAVIKKFESHIQRATIENKAGLVATTTDNPA